jgi:two-component system sensor histidine kinase CreC
VSNLIQNAIDFSRPQGTISSAARADGHSLQLSIEDSGTSIPAYAQEKIFDKFYSLKRPDSGRKSTGLGLNLVKQVALLHNGDIQLKNRSLQGVQAILTLPLKKRFRVQGSKLNPATEP